ncbi:hypothetical protein K443DRAFT_680534, partial [Laccaria amethystina LaAM-08-1]
MIVIDLSGNSYITVSCSNYASTPMESKTLMRSEIGAMMIVSLRLTLLCSAIAPIPLVFR